MGGPGGLEPSRLRAQRERRLPFERTGHAPQAKSAGFVPPAIGGSLILLSRGNAWGFSSWSGTHAVNASSSGQICGTRCETAGCVCLCVCVYRSHRVWAQAPVLSLSSFDFLEP